MIRRTASLNPIVLLALMSAACAAPISQIGPASLEDIRTEQVLQQTVASQISLSNQQRVARVAHPLLRAAAPLCGTNLRIVSRPTTSDASGVAPAGAVDTVCGFTVTVQRDGDARASADGRGIVLSTALLRFTNDDELSVVIAHDLAHSAMRHLDAMKRDATSSRLPGAAAGAMPFSQDFEREADYVALYILAWAGEPIDNAATLWHRFALEHPPGLTYADMHPIISERFDRLEQWEGEINRKIVSGSAFGPDVRDRRVAVVSRASSMVSATTSLASVDATPTQVATQAPATARSARADAAPRAPNVELQGTLPARVTIGVPLPAADRRAAVVAYEQGKVFLGSHHWGYAKARFREALRLDPSVAAYHAGLGEVFMVEHDWAAAAAAYATAHLLDPDNTTYRTRLNEARAVMSY